MGEREREVQAPTVKRRLSAREKQDENKAMSDLSGRINQLTKLILTSQTVADARGDEVCLIWMSEDTVLMDVPVTTFESL